MELRGYYHSLAGFDCSAEVDAGSKFTLHWALSAQSLKIGLQGETSGYLSVAWTENAEKMIGSEAVIGWVGSDGVASVKTYDLNGKSSS
eukprot:gene25284-30862_t